MTEMKIKDPLTLVSGPFDNWYCIERAEHDHTGKIAGQGFVWSGRISDADVDGTAEEMLTLAYAIERREWESHKRCAVDARAALGGNVEFWSPRNSQRRGRVSLVAAQALAREIREKLEQKPIPPVSIFDASAEAMGAHVLPTIDDLRDRALGDPKGVAIETLVLLGHTQQSISSLPPRGTANRRIECERLTQLLGECRALLEMLANRLAREGSS